MESSIKSIHAIKGTLLIKTLFACLIVAAFSFAAIPAWAGDAEADAKQALENLKGAMAKVDKAKEDLKKAQEALDKGRAKALKDGKLSASEKALLQTLANAVAKAEAALKAAEDEFYQALRALEDALEKLKDDSAVKKELKRQRDILIGSRFGTSRPQVVIANGLRTVNFGTLNGQVIVNLTDDISAGDTISGTVIAEPKGQTPEERTKNAVAMKDDLVAFFAADPTQPNAPPVVIFDLSKGLPQPDGSTIVTQTFTAPKKANVGLFSMPNQNHPIGACGRSGSLVAINESCSPISQLVFESPDQGIITPDPKMTPTFNIPTLGQTGRPIVITGPFDGNAANTILYAALRTSVQDFEKNTENVSAGFGLLAESHGKAVFQSATNVTGPIEMRLNEGNTQTTGTYRNVGVNLTAPKTSLLKGESTELHVEVNGLQGLTQPVPLTLESHGVITMEGGMYQPLVIQPSQVGADGRYTTTRAITGVQAGDWSATGTVVTQRDVQANEPGQPPGPVADATPSATPGGTKLSGSNRKVTAAGLEGQTIHIEGSPQSGAKGLFRIKIKTQSGAIAEVFIAADETPDLKFCNSIKVGKAHDGRFDPIIDSYEKTEDPTPKPPPTGPKPGDKTEPPPTVTPPPTPPTVPQTPPANPPGDTVARECDPEGAKKTVTRTEITCEVSDAVVTKYGISPTGEALMNIFGAIMKIAGAGKGVKLGEQIAGAFSTSAARNIYVKVKKTTTTYKDLYVCEHGKWVLKGQDGAPTSETSESGWIKLMNVNNGGTDYWLAGDSTGDVEAAVAIAKQTFGCP